MSPSRVYPSRRRTQPPTETRDQIVSTVRTLLEEGAFHESTVEEVASRAGVARATLYQHFGSRLGLVDAICETFGKNPALHALREAVDLDAFIVHIVEFWATEEKVLDQLYGAAALDPAAGDLVERQHRDRQRELKRLVGGLRLRRGLTEREALALLSVLSSFETYQELRHRASLSKREVVRTLQQTARLLLLP